jgi:hypothetical protein
MNLFGLMNRVCRLACDTVGNVWIPATAKSRGPRKRSYLARIAATLSLVAAFTPTEPAGERGTFGMGTIAKSAAVTASAVKPFKHAQMLCALQKLPLPPIT